MSNKNNDELQRQASDNTLGLNPVIGIRRKDLLSTARTVLRRPCASHCTAPSTWRTSGWS